MCNYFYKNTCTYKYLYYIYLTQQQQSGWQNFGNMKIAEEIAIQFGVSVERIKQQYAENAKCLKEGWEKAKASGKKYRGATADHWKERYEFFLAQSK